MDVPGEPEHAYSRSKGYENMPLVSLEEALQPVHDLIPNMDRYAWIAKRNSSTPLDGLTLDESAAIYIYTMEGSSSEESLYCILNRTLRSNDRSKLKPWFSNIKLFMTALYKLPSFDGTVWRGVKGNLSTMYQKGGTYVWWTYSTATLDMETLEAEHVLGKHGPRTLFSIQCKHGKDISRHSNFPNEEEVLLMPGFQFQVLSRVDLGNDLCMVNVKETEPATPLCSPPF